jgi:putative tricarboxylic transport membrane protein
MWIYAFWLLLGTCYGFLIGLVPIAGAATALLSIYGFLDVFRHDPYTLVIFTTAIVVSCTIGDNFSSIVMNIPGSAGSAATMVDGFPLAKQGQGARALSAAIFTSIANGLLWGLLTFLFISYYAPFILYFGVPELLAFMIVAMTSLCFVTSNLWFRSMIALGLGITAGMVGQNPFNGAPMLTGGWEYLHAGIQITPLMSGLLAFPELIETYLSGFSSFEVQITDVAAQMHQGFRDSIRYWRDGFRGGVIGAVVGLLPGIGGAIADWLAYSQTVNAHPEELFGNGNIRGMIGCEGANNAQKATSYVPTILFGIPAAPFDAVIMSLFVLVGLECGTPALLSDHQFFSSMAFGYMGSLVLTLGLALWCIKYVNLIFRIPFWVWFWFLTALITWSCVQYTGYWEDYAMLGICILLGMSMKWLKLSRPAFIIGFVLSPRLVALSHQYIMLYDWYAILQKPVSAALLVIAVVMIIKGIFYNKTRLTYV